MVDAADLKSASRKGVGVRIPSWAPVYRLEKDELPLIGGRLFVFLTAKLTATSLQPLCDPSRMSPIFSAASRCAAGKTCEYVFMVRLMVECPSVSITTRG